jgi:hypothetical protein
MDPHASGIVRYDIIALVWNFNFLRGRPRCINHIARTTRHVERFARFCKILAMSLVVQVCSLCKFLDLYNTEHGTDFQNHAKSSAWRIKCVIWFIHAPTNKHVLAEEQLAQSQRFTKESSTGLMTHDHTVSA